ncbi:MAG: hypothetical protein KC476_11870 [Cyanobacteria bacterium HKST-UBA06]|nr:hypothetical protein [Cyanobacteria bacterium HKST-UBA04]MCA9808642.1 hypothetical protein [Cyanobacteria bacterium HKST-UBA06]MCA9840852.1 hypothetical protein [Cyanobacteria bacterium HKST-UBA03]
MRYPHHVLAQLQRFAPYIGGRDQNGRMHDLGEHPVVRQRQHVFQVTHKHHAQAAPTMVGGHVIADLIVSDCYDVVYLGTEQELADCRKTKPGTSAPSVCAKRLAAFDKAHTAAIEAGQKLRRERLGQL